MIGIGVFVRRRRRWRRRKPRSIFSDYSVDAGPQLIVTPFDPNYSFDQAFDTNQDSGIPAEQQPLVIGDPEGEIVSPHRLSSSPPAIPLRQLAPAPVGWSDKEIARLRAENRSSPQPRNFGASGLTRTQPTSPPNAVTGPGESSYDTRRLHTEFESLRREVEQLRAEGFAPPSYSGGDG